MQFYTGITTATPAAEFRAMEVQTDVAVSVNHFRNACRAFSAEIPIIPQRTRQLVLDARFFFSTITPPWQTTTLETQSKR
jgi:hypothetical protein